MKRVYSSGPLFCPEEIAGMASIAEVLEKAGFDTFLPHRDGLERFVMPLVNTPVNNNFLGVRDIINKAIFALDVFQIVHLCDGFVLNMNGRVPDEGAVAEAGIAFAAGKPVVLYKNDSRSVFKGIDNSMITGLSVLKPVSHIRKLPQALIKAEHMMESMNPSGMQCVSANVERAVRTGEKIWNVIRVLPLRNIHKKETQDLVKKILDICDQLPDED
ncbi:MAG TPA: nucleoside 2-deoxyribosyltransferase [Deltaproteobacteria bacterium]|nr:nucleoside 2-deoxyribosyltransferase [Deltaproteobacteria bacterium]